MSILGIVAFYEFIQIRNESPDLDGPAPKPSNLLQATAQDLDASDQVSFIEENYICKCNLSGQADYRHGGN